MDESLPRKMKNFLLIVLLQMYPFSLKRSRCQISSGDNIILIMYYKYHVAIGFENICIKCEIIKTDPKNMVSYGFKMAFWKSPLIF